jgi:hypothetical protein
MDGKAIDDDRMSALLRGPDCAPDERFVQMVERRIIAEQRFAAVRQALWRRFAVEAAASAAMLAAFILLYRLVRFGSGGDVWMLNPGVAAALIIGLWFAVELRPAARQ